MWLIQKYSKDSDSLISESKVADISVYEIRDLLGLESDDPVFDDYPVTLPNAQSLGQLLHYDFDLASYDYFVSYED